MARITYLVRVKDQTGAKVAEFIGRGRRVSNPGGLIGLFYYKRLRTPGQSTIRIDGLDNRVSLLNLDNSGTLDSQIEFWRRDLFGGAAYEAWLTTLPSYKLDSSMPGWYKDFEVFHRYHEFDQDQEGLDQFTSRGSGYNVLLEAEPIRYAANSIYTSKSGATETVIKEYVDENVGPSATSPPRDRSGVMPGLTIQANSATGNTWSGARANKNLLDVCKELAEFGPGDYMIVGTGAATFEFQWADQYWGSDKRLGNTAGNPPVVFAAEYGTATNIRYIYNRLNEVNTVDVLGVGKAGDRVVVTQTSGTESDSPWNTRSVAREQNNEWNTTILQDKADETLNRQRAKRVFRFDALQTQGLRYGRDWDMGDLVTLVYRGQQVDQKIIGVRVTLDSDGKEVVRPEVEDWLE